jgi:hypothetical protein
MELLMLARGAIPEVSMRRAPREKCAKLRNARRQINRVFAPVTRASLRIQPRGLPRSKI